MVAANGVVIRFGDASILGSLPSLGITPAAPIVGIAVTPDGWGYWLVGQDGGVCAFGDAPFLGSMGARRSTSRWLAWLLHATAVATRRWHPTAASSASGTLTSSGAWAEDRGCQGAGRTTGVPGHRDHNPLEQPSGHPFQGTMSVQGYSYGPSLHTGLLCPPCGNIGLCGRKWRWASDHCRSRSCWQVAVRILSLPSGPRRALLLSRKHRRPPRQPRPLHPNRRV